MTNSNANGTAQAASATDAAPSMGAATDGATTETAAAAANDDTASPNADETVVTTAATVGAVVVGAALFEVALIPGIALGVVAMLAPQYASKIVPAISPVLRSSVRGIYKFGQKTNEIVAEAKEQMQDIVAEVKAQDDVKAETKAKPAPQPAAAAAPTTPVAA